MPPLVQEAPPEDELTRGGVRQEEKGKIIERRVLSWGLWLSSIMQGQLNPAPVPKFMPMPMDMGMNMSVGMNFNIGRVSVINVELHPNIGIKIGGL